MMIRSKTFHCFAFLTILGAACGGDDDQPIPLDPDTAPRVMVDRFGADSGTLFVRTADNGLPGPDEPIDFDQAPFVTQGLGPEGEIVRYYNFDVMTTESAPIFALFRESDESLVAGQLNIIGVLPGDGGYSDFWHVHKVLVPDDYVANTLTNVEDVMASGYTIERTNLVVNCPVVPEGSTAALRHGGGGTELVSGWYRDQLVSYFEFGEKTLTVEPPATGHPIVPTSPIFVSFNANPMEGDPSSGPASGFKMLDGSSQTHNVVSTLPEDEDYSPLWSVRILDNADFDSVVDLTSALAANLLADGPTVNCPIVDVQ